MKEHKIHKDKITALIHRIGLKYGLSDNVIRELVGSPYEFSYGIMKALDLSKIETEEELDELKTNFYYKGIGKLFVPFSRISRRNTQKKNMSNLNKSKWKK